MSDEYRKACERKGYEYQDFVVQVLYRYGIHLNCYTSFKNQIELGENVYGGEIKFDDIHKSTDRLFIEFAEKKPKAEKFTPSGIMTRSWQYIIGDYNNIYCFPTKLLRQYYGHRDGKYEPWSDDRKEGFLIERKTINKGCSYHIVIYGDGKEPNRDTKMFVGDKEILPLV